MSYTHGAIERLKADRATAYAQARAIIDNANAAKRCIDGNETQQFKRLNAEIDRLDAEIRRMEADTFRAPAAPFVQPASTGMTESRGAAAFLDLVRNGGSFDLDTRNVTVRVDRDGSHTIELRDLYTTSGSNAIVPTDMLSEMVTALVESSGVLSTNIRRLPTSDGRPIDIPISTTYGTATKVSEGSAIPESDPVLRRVTSTPVKFAKVLSLSNELLEDSAVDVRGFIAQEAGWAIGYALNPKLVNGTGSGEPEGVFHAAATGLTGQNGATGLPSADELIRLQHSVTAPYRRNGWFLMHDSTLSWVRRLKDSYGRYLLEPSLRAGVPDTILGSPVSTDVSIPACGTGVCSVAFGDLSRGFIYREAPYRFEFSRDASFSSDMTDYRVVLRADQRMTDPYAQAMFRGGTA
ncbi:MAG: phage major capsid protein [Acidimicrobiales bacterium]